MTFRLDPSWGGLDELLTRHGLAPVAFVLNVKAVPWIDIDEDVVAETLEPAAPGEPFRVGGLPVFVYIRDTRIKKDHATAEQAARHPEQYTRIHLTDCSTLLEMKNNNRFGRFVRTNKKEGALRMNLERASGEILEARISLRVCMNCLSSLNWRNYREFPPRSSQRTAIWEGFSRLEFLEFYSPSFPTTPESHEDDPAHTYTPDWSDASKRVRERAGYQCNACLVRVERTEARLLDAHHKNHRKNDNRQENLSALCKLCHADIHPHYSIDPRDADRLAALRAAQGIAR